MGMRSSGTSRGDTIRGGQFSIDIEVSPLFSGTGNHLGVSVRLIESLGLINCMESAEYVRFHSPLSCAAHGHLTRDRLRR